MAEDLLGVDPQHGASGTGDGGPSPAQLPAASSPCFSRPQTGVAARGGDAEKSFLLQAAAVGTPGLVPVPGPGVSPGHAVDGVGATKSLLLQLAVPCCFDHPAVGPSKTPSRFSVSGVR
mmetsp:Transcript_75942/g.240247  ORF Transcript_75942/g.240247 Transcript_75942/m.240247 type:complete len:119 (+) Transcript_75942:409-765(+)